MKQYLSSEQTAKLIELGFEKPKMAAPALKWVDGEPTFEPQYTIGELIEMLPKEIKHPVWFGKKKMREIGWWELRIDSMGKEYPWAVVYYRESSAPLAMEYAAELIDALYAMILQLKEEGVI